MAAGERKPAPAHTHTPRTNLRHSPGPLLLAQSFLGRPQTDAQLAQGRLCCRLHSIGLLFRHREHFRQRPLRIYRLRTRPTAATCTQAQSRHFCRALPTSLARGDHQPENVPHGVDGSLELTTAGWIHLSNKASNRWTQCKRPSLNYEGVLVLGEVEVLTAYSRDRLNHRYSMSGGIKLALHRPYAHHWSGEFSPLFDRVGDIFYSYRSRIT